MNTINSSVPAFTLGTSLSLTLADGKTLPVRCTQAPLAEALDAVQVSSAEQLHVLARLAEYPYLRSLLDENCLDYARQRRQEVREWLREGIYLFGAYKVGGKLARQALKSGITLKGFLDNDAAKAGSLFEGVSVQHPTTINLTGQTVVVASGRHSNAISRQLAQQPGVRIVNMHEFMYAVGMGHGPEVDFAAFVEAPSHDRYRFISAFVRLNDEVSRLVFDRLIGMRIRLSTELADEIKSPFDQEYFDQTFVSDERAAYFADAGAATGDTLQRLERHFPEVKQAWLFEPELPSYYEALKTFASRKQVWVFNLGLDEAPSRAQYQPELTFDWLNEIQGPISAGTTSYIQGIALDQIVSGPVGLFKLDVEGMEARVLRGSRKTIERDKPTLAVCAYHRADDYWRLIDEVSAVRTDYRIGIRLYADILEDITLYFY